jgi:hypothetical protein
MATTKSSTRQKATPKAATKASFRKTGAKKKSSSLRKYSPAAGDYVKEEMKEMKQGKLKSGGSGKKVTDPKQAIAIGLSEARRAGKKVPAPPHRKAA